MNNLNLEHSSFKVLLICLALGALSATFVGNLMGNGMSDITWQDLPVEKKLKLFLTNVLGGEDLRVIYDGDINNDGFREIIAVRPLGRPWGREVDMSIEEETIINGVVVQTFNGGRFAYYLKLMKQV